MVKLNPEQRLHKSFGLTAGQLDKVFDRALGANRDSAFCDIYLQAGSSQSLVWDKGGLKTTANGLVCGAGVRVVIGDRQGYSFTDHPTFSNIRRAAGFAKMIADQSKQLPELDADIAANIGKPHNLYSVAASPLTVPVEERISLLRQIDALARSFDHRIKNVTISLGIEEYDIVIANNLGEFVVDNRPLIRLSVECLAVEGNRKEKGSGSGGGRSEFSFFYAEDLWKKYTLAAAQEAIDMLKSVPSPAGEMTVVLGPGWPGVLIHEAVGHGLEGDFNRKGTSAFSGRIGEMVASPLCTVIDQGDVPGRRGSLNVDDEGVPTSTAVLIENGVLKGYMQDRTNAALMKAKATGNGRRQSYRHAPMPRMTNTFLANGESDPEEIIRSVKHGIFAMSFPGGQVDITSGDFTFSTSGAYLIEDGKLTVPVKGATLIGNGPRAMMNISMVGNDTALDNGIGMCGKDGQSVPVGVGMPTVRIDNVTVGGTNN